jgi:DNA repair exonuclease SbcCD ATPase subunit
MAFTTTTVGNRKTAGGHMSVIESLKGTLQRGKSNPMSTAKIKGTASRVNNEMDELEKLVEDRIVRLRASVRDGEAAVAAATQHTEQFIESLKTEIAALESQLDAARTKELASQKMEQTLTAKIGDLQGDLKKKEDALESRGKEVNELKSKIDTLGKQITQLEAAIRQAKAQANEEAKRAQNLAESSMAKIAALEAQLRDREEIARTKESTFKGLERNLTAKIQDLERHVENKGKIIADRDRQINELNSQLATLTNGIKGMSSFFKQAEALVPVEVQEPGTVIPGADERPTNSELKNNEVPSDVADGARETVSPDFFYLLTNELAETVGPFSSVIVREHVTDLGESIEQFPTTRVKELVEILSQEITDENLKIRFRERVIEQI